MRKFLLPLFLIAFVASMPIHSAFAKKTKNHVTKKSQKSNPKVAKAQSKKKKNRRAIASDESHSKKKHGKKANKPHKEKKKKH